MLTHVNVLLRMGNVEQFVNFFPVSFSKGINSWTDLRFFFIPYYSNIGHLGWHRFLFTASGSGIIAYSNAISVIFKTFRAVTIVKHTIISRFFQDWFHADGTIHLFLPVLILRSAIFVP